MVISVHPIVLHVLVPPPPAAPALRIVMYIYVQQLVQDSITVNMQKRLQSHVTCLPVPLVVLKLKAVILIVLVLNIVPTQVLPLLVQKLVTVPATVKTVHQTVVHHLV